MKVTKKKPQFEISNDPSVPIVSVIGRPISKEPCGHLTSNADGICDECHAQRKQKREYKRSYRAKERAK